MSSIAPVRASLLRRRWRLRRTPFSSFWLKVAGAVAIVALADDLSGRLCHSGGGGLFAVFGLASLTAVLATRPAIWHDAKARLAVVAALVLCAALLNDPGVPELLALWAAFGMAALLPRAGRFGDVWLWTKRLFLAGCQAVVWLPLRDLVLLSHPRFRRNWPGLRLGVAALIVPLLGSILFILLFARANPVIERLLPRLDLDSLLEELSPGRVIFWGVVFCAIWGVLRPRLRIRPMHNVAGAVLVEAIRAFLLSRRSLLASLVSFNLLFAVQNALDLVFLAGGASLPDGMTFAEYAHRGAYPLIVTALLAAMFVLVAMRPGMGTAIRWLVLAWVGQNLLLVVFSATRTLDYVAAYDLTVLRIAALVWMALVGFGLVTIVLRIVQGRSPAWLVNVNAAATALVLIACSFADLGGLAAHYNVRHAREITGQGQPLDQYYLFHRLGLAALPAIAWLAAESMPGDLQERACRRLRDGKLHLAAVQGDWLAWSGLNARILAALGDNEPATCGAYPLNPPTAMVPEPDAPAPETDVAMPPP